MKELRQKLKISEDVKKFANITFFCCAQSAASLLAPVAVDISACAV